MFSRQSQRALRRSAPTRWRFNGASCRAKFTDAQHTNGQKIVFSGIQPTGIPHLGNYLGALRPWVKIQDEAQHGDVLIFCIVDLHAITVAQKREQLIQWKREMYASLLAVGLDPTRSVIYAQSQVRMHSELMWLLSCNASMGYLGRMTQWKSKLALPEHASPLDPSPSNKPALKLGLFSYPVLQAADILLFRTTHVPVGEDQAQHLEFTRELANTMNHLYGSIFTPPQTLLSPAKRVMSLQDPLKKMSKSDPDPKSRVLITDTREEIHWKINAALTDSIAGITYDRAARPGVSNLLDIMHYMDESKGSPEDLARDMFGQNMSMKALKEKVADTIDHGIADVRERYHEQMARPDREVVAEIRHNVGRAGAYSGRTMINLRNAMGLE